MASVAKWLRQWIVVPPLVGSSPIVRPLSFTAIYYISVETARLPECQYQATGSHGYTGLTRLPGLKT